MTRAAQCGTLGGMETKLANRMALALAVVLAVWLAAPGARAFDLPVYLDFNLGFRLRVMPGPDDASRAHCLGVGVDKITTDKKRSLHITGKITNYSGSPCAGVAMRFAVTSHIGIGKSLGTATVTPDYLPPGGTATFNLHLTLDSPRPKFAMYTITAGSPALCDWAVSPVPEAEPELIIPSVVAPPVEVEGENESEDKEADADVIADG